MVRWANTPLSQSDAHAVAKNWTGIARHLPAPDESWEWNSSGLQHSTLVCLSTRNLIEQGDDGWCATEDLWEFVTYHARGKSGVLVQSTLEGHDELVLLDDERTSSNTNDAATVNEQEQSTFDAYVEA